VKFQTTKKWGGGSTNNTGPLSKSQEACFPPRFLRLCNYYFILFTFNLVTFYFIYCIVLSLYFLLNVTYFMNVHFYDLLYYYCYLFYLLTLGTYNPEYIIFIYFISGTTKFYLNINYVFLFILYIVIYIFTCIS